MPDFQKSENLSFILSKIPMDSSGGGSSGGKLQKANHSEIQRILMKALIAVAEKHSGTLFSSNLVGSSNAHLLRFATSYNHYDFLNADLTPLSVQASNG